MELTQLNNITPLADISGYILLFVRIIFGVIFLYYGRFKIKDLKQNAKDFDSMGFSPGWLFGTPVALLETIGSAAIILGFMTAFVAAAFAVHMFIGALWKITSTDKPFTDWSYDLSLLSLSLLLLVTGPGKFNILFS